LLLDAELFELNISAMAEHVSRAGKRLRPHAKAHKCVEIARRQVNALAAGVCVATVPEAELMVRAGIPGVLLTSPIADPAKCMRMAELAALAADTAVVVDHVKQARMYSSAAEQAGVTLNVLVDIDVGDHRTGISPGEPALQLAEAIRSDRNLSFAGLQAYSVRASHIEDMEARANYSAGVLNDVLLTRQLLESRGIGVPIVTGGSTGSCLCDSALPYMTELQAGSYALMDVAYGQLHGVDFRHALSVLATVVSANHLDRVTVDAGFKAFATDRPFGPKMQYAAGARYEWGGDEFGYVFPGPRQRMQLGDRLRFIPPHCDPTVNLYDQIHVCRGEEVEDVWPIMGG
jgi:D-serine deaminase-like pyridoxal phosphate-dependent protein